MKLKSNLLEMVKEAAHREGLTQDELNALISFHSLDEALGLINDECVQFYHGIKTYTDLAHELIDHDIHNHEEIIKRHFDYDSYAKELKRSPWHSISREHKIGVVVL